MGAAASPVRKAVVLLALILAPIGIHVAMATQRGLALAGLLVIAESGLIAWIALSFVPVRSLRWIDALLAGMTASGFTGSQAVEAYKAFTSFLLGHLLLEVAQLNIPIGPEETARADGRAPSADLRGYPSVRKLSSLLAEDTAAEEFRSSLENLLRRIGQMLESGPISAGRVQ